MENLCESLGGWLTEELKMTSTRNKQQVTPRAIASLIIIGFFLPLTASTQELPAKPFAEHILNLHQNVWYEIIVSEAEMKKIPPWPETDENPPLSVRQAIRIGTDHVARIFEDGKDWKFYRITLRRSGLKTHWVYVVDFLPASKVPAKKEVKPFQIIVLMNGEPAPITRRAAPNR
jgi:hypothetical protein